MGKNAAIADAFCMLPGIPACRKLTVRDTRKMLERHLLKQPWSTRSGEERKIFSGL